MLLPNCHFFVVTILSLPNCHFFVVTKLLLPNGHFFVVTKLSLFCCYQFVLTKLSFLWAYQIVITKLSLPNFHLTKLSLPKCYYKLSLPNWHYQKSAHHIFSKNVEQSSIFLLRKVFYSWCLNCEKKLINRMKKIIKFEYLKSLFFQK